MKKIRCYYQKFTEIVQMHGCLPALKVYGINKWKEHVP